VSPDLQHPGGEDRGVYGVVISVKEKFVNLLPALDIHYSGPVYVSKLQIIFCAFLAENNLANALSRLSGLGLFCWRLQGVHAIRGKLRDYRNNDYHSDEGFLERVARA
jgi:hypothetical protein